MLKRREFIGSFLLLPVLGDRALANDRRSSRIVTRQALHRINAYRKSQQRDALIIDPRAEMAALAHSKEMALLGELTHRNLKKRLADAEIVLPSAENVAVGQKDIGAVLTAWQNSSDHRSNLLGAYNRVGLAVARNSNSGNVPYWTLILSV